MTRKGDHDDRRGIPRIRLRSQSTATPEAVYGLLADLRSHLDWGGERQSAGFRLLTMDAPPGRATVGVEFRSTGTDGKHRVNQDRSVVTEATAPSVFEFVTESRCLRKDGTLAMDATVVHRFEIAPIDGGCTAAYTAHTVRLEPVPAIFRLPVLSSMARRILGSMLRRGFRNLLAMAEEGAVAQPTA